MQMVDIEWQLKPTDVEATTTHMVCDEMNSLKQGCGISPQSLGL